MIKYTATRIAWAIPVIFVILVVNFILIHIVPGDPVTALIGDYPAPPAYVAQVRHAYGLDLPISTQLWLYLWHVVHGNLGYSFANDQPVLQLILTRAEYTLLLVIPALVLASISGILLGVVAAPRAGRASDGLIAAVSLAGYSVPVFWLGQLLVLLFAVRLGWLPSQGVSDLTGSQSGIGHDLAFLRHWALPGFCLTVYYIAVVARVSRSSVLEALHQDYVLTARAKGLSQRYILWRHVLPNAIIPVAIVVGYNFGYALTGAILVETVFAWPGIGNLFFVSIANRDYPVLEGIFLLTAISVLVANLLTDLLYGTLDPRIRTRAADA